MEELNITVKKLTRVNRDIRESEVLLIDQEGEKVGVIETYKALEKAAEANLDLVEIAPTVTPSVCRIMDYGKYRFDKSKKRTAQRKKQKRTHIKEVKFRPGTEVADYNVKIRNATRFLEHGDKVKITLRYRGRELAHHELGINLLKRVQQDLTAYSVVEQQPKFEGRQVIMILSPKKE